jgi:hypothetical protein
MGLVGYLTEFFKPIQEILDQVRNIPQTFPDIANRWCIIMYVGILLDEVIGTNVPISYFLVFSLTIL